MLKTPMRDALIIFNALKEKQLSVVELGLLGTAGNMTSLRAMLTVLTKIGLLVHIPIYTDAGRLAHAYGIVGWDYSTIPATPPDAKTRDRLWEAFEILMFEKSKAS